ncbi:MAG TPA: hypothetical protein VM165_05960, partial [Planctomycetaceae bacterium]|nr:hypothetical protein [Planctomycetaceae bacterium]
TVGDQRCRWIEVRVQSEESVRKGVGTAYKLLIPEQELKADGDAVKAAIEVWRKPADENAHKIEGLIDNPRLYLLLFPLLPGRVRERQILKERETVAWQRGTLDCAIVEGQVKDSFTYDRVTGRCRFVVHESVPFGFAAVHLKIDNADAEHGVVSLSLIDQGTDAVSDLPNVK